MTAELPEVTERFTADLGPYIAALQAGIDQSDRFAEAVAKDAAAVSGLNTAADTRGVDSLNTSLAAATVSGGYFGGWLRRAASYDLPLFGGVLDGTLPKVLAVATGTHLLVDGFIELAGVAVPAAIAFAAFGVAAAPTAQDIYDQMKNVLTVTQATGQSLYPVTGGFTRMADAVRPEVYQLFGDALTIANHGTGQFTGLAVGAGQALDLLAARFTVAITQGSGLGGILAHASADLFGLGTVVGNVGGILGNFMKVVPGYAEDLLALAGGVTHVAEAFTGWAPVQDALGLLLKLHGGFLYAGLGVTMFARLIPSALAGVAGLAEKSAYAAASSSLLGGAAETAGSGLLGFAVGAEKAAGLPWGWILTAAAGFGVLTYAIITSKDATQQWLAGMQDSIQAATVMRGITDISNAQIQVDSRLAAAQRELANTAQYQTMINTHTGESMRVVSFAYTQAQQQVSDLTSGQRQLGDETRLYGYRVGQLAHTYGSAGAAQGMLIAAGVPMSLMLNKSSLAFAEIKAMVEATSNAYRAMGQTGGILGADMSVLNTLAGNQYQAMTRLNQAWATFLGLSTSLVTGIDGVISGMRQVEHDAKATGASFMGTNSASLALRNSFEQQYSGLEQVIRGMTQAGDSSHQLAGVMSTALKPGVDQGALANSGLRQQIYDMARQAGYAGPNAIGPLTRFIDQSATSMHHMAALADGAAGSLAHLAGQAGATSRAVQNYISWLHQIPASIATHLNVDISASIQEYKSFAAQHGGYAGGTDFAAPGPHRVAEMGAELIVQPSVRHFAGGERVVPPAQTRAILSGGGGPPVVNVTINVAHTIASQQELYQLVQKAVLDAWTRNRGMGLVPHGFPVR